LKPLSANARSKPKILSINTNKMSHWLTLLGCVVVITGVGLITMGVRLTSNAVALTKPVAQDVRELGKDL
jgi:hypothetical protein